VIFMKERTYTSVPCGLHTLQRVHRDRNARARPFLHKPSVIFSPLELTSTSSG
jgi:hypothetical protein